ncbi:uncharacterized protein LOC143597695 [Bidens hawaiensis]|uniref:uncharacterized protein LOC143597695 n=1 Tax=Bidens hawaiensis TaxID=980011 RepID=UPI00404B98F0
MSIALRLSRHLLLGVVRIYSKKRDLVMVMHLELVVEKAATQELAAAAGSGGLSWLRRAKNELKQAKPVNQSIRIEPDRIRIEPDCLVIMSLVDVTHGKHRHVPYRDSRLTFLLQMLVDEYTMIEAQRLHYIHAKQHDLRCDTYESLREVKRFLKDATLKSEDRPDILCRLFKLKLDSMIKELKEKSSFGKLFTRLNFRKRGLPHAHICMFMHAESKILNPQLIDNFISAEIPNKNSEPELYKLVSNHMIHGPCGEANPKCTCMVNKRCSKNFPKRFQNETSIDSEGFPVYKRRDNGEYVVKSDINLDNRSVVPYNKTLLKKFQAHINVEWCNQDGSIKYVSACEATWRIFAFDVHCRLPSVMRLAFHLPGEHQVIYGADDDDIEDVLNKTTNASSMLTELSLNEEQLKNLALLEIEKFLVSNNSTLRRYKEMLFPDKDSISRATNPLMVEELSYDTETIGGVFFVYGYGGTGKTYLWKTLSASIRSKGEVVLNVASSGIASLLLEVKGNTDVYELLKKTSLIIWDEAPMIHKHAFEALDRTLKDVMAEHEAYSWMWTSNLEEIKEFADWLLDIGEGNVGGPNDGESIVEIPDDLLILNSLDPIGDLIQFVYPNMLDRFNEVTYFQDRALLAPLNEVVQEINERMLALF